TGALLLAADALAVAASGWLGAQIWSRVNDAVIAETYLRLWPASIAFLAAYAMLGLYPGVGLSPVEELRRTVIGTTIVYLVASASIFLSKEISFYSRGVFLVCWASTAVAVPLCRAVLRHCCAARSWWGVPVVVVGAGPAGERVARNLQAQPELGLKPVAFLDDDGEAAAVDRGWFRGSHALVAMPGLSRQDLLKVLERMTAVFSHVIVIPDLFGMASLWVSARDLGGVLGLEVRQNLLNPVNRWMKRGLDLAVAAVAGVLAAPLVAAAALWIKWISPGPAFFLQERGGAGERSIRVWKLRTMYPDAAPMLERHLEQHPEDRQQWQQHFKLKQDPRLLPVIGALLRRTSLDEVPQLWNVIRGDMSLVGPRPLPSYHLEEFDQDFRHLRARVLPGLTGLWQVSTRSDGDLEVQQALDSYYIRNWSLWLDLHILARTVRAVLLRQGAY
ncbi:MAG: undecaprenyl-phosphate galactose phosphotransferase WbaP, partial [Acidobacteriales bacterium]